MAEYKLRAADSLREVEMIQKMGVEFRFGVSIDSASALRELEAEFDYIFLGLGLGAMQRLGVPGEEIEGRDERARIDLRVTRSGTSAQMHGTVVVVGAGNTAIDAANAARRLGAQKVYMLYRRGESDMSAFNFEYEHAKQEGVQFLWRMQPLAIKPEAHGRLRLETVQVQTVDRKLMPIPDSQITIDCDLIVPAIGQSPLAQLVQECAAWRCATGASSPIARLGRPGIRATLRREIA